MQKLFKLHLSKFSLFSKFHPKNLTVIAFLFSIGIYIGCSKDQLPRVPDSQLATDRTDGAGTGESNPCDVFPGMVGISYQTVRYNENQQIADMYTMISESDIEPLAEQLIAMHETQGQAATLAYMQTLGYSSAEISLLNSFFNQVSTLDYNNLTNASIETFANGFRDYVCQTYLPTGPSGPSGPIVPATASNLDLSRRGQILANNAEGDLKALVEMSRGAGSCASCGFKMMRSMGYYAFSGSKFGAKVGSVAGPKGAAAGAVVGAIAGALYGANNALKSSSCKSCFGGSNGPTCVSPTKITFDVKGCNEVWFNLSGQNNLPAQHFDWFNQNATPDIQRTTSPQLRSFIPNPNIPTEVVVYYDDCNNSQEQTPNSFMLRDDFLSHGTFGALANSSSIPANGQTEIIVSPGKIWNTALYSISYQIVQGSGLITNWPVNPSSQFTKVYTAGYGSGSPGQTGTTIIRVTITNLCLNTTVTKDVTITVI